MLQAILVWTGAVLALVVMLLLALGPVIVEVDSWWYERRHDRRRRRVQSARSQPADPAPAVSVPDSVPDVPAGLSA